MGTSKLIDSSAAFYLKFLNRIRRLHCRNFKQAALALEKAVVRTIPPTEPYLAILF
jgi:hypothetical protein